MKWKRGNRLKLVSENEASGRTREIFAEVRYALGLPAVPLLYRAYATFPAFLEVHWEAFRPAMQSRQFFTLGNRLAAEAYTRAHNYFQVRDLAARLAARDPEQQIGCAPLTQVIDYYQYLDPLQLLIAAGQLQALEGPTGRREAAIEPPARPEFSTVPEMIEEEAAPSSVQRIWDERRRLLDLAYISDEHRALATWPEFYQEYWLALRQLMASPLYADSQYRVAESALGLARELPARIETSVPHLLEAGLTVEDVASLSRISEVLLHSLSGQVLDITFARIGCEGGTRHEKLSKREEKAPVKAA